MKLFFQLHSIFENPIKTTYCKTQLILYIKNYVFGINNREYVLSVPILKFLGKFLVIGCEQNRVIFHYNCVTGTWLERGFVSARWQFYLLLL